MGEHQGAPELKGHFSWAFLSPPGEIPPQEEGGERNVPPSSDGDKNSSFKFHWQEIDRR